MPKGALMGANMDCGGRAKRRHRFGSRWRDWRSLDSKGGTVNRKRCRRLALPPQSIPHTTSSSRFHATMAADGRERSSAAFEGPRFSGELTPKRDVRLASGFAKDHERHFTQMVIAPHRAFAV